MCVFPDWHKNCPLACGGMQLILKWAIFVWISKLTQKLPTKRCFLAFFKVGIFCVNFQIDTNLPTQMSFLAFFKVGIFCVFFQIYTKIAHLHSTAEFKLLPQVGSFCVIFQFTPSDLEKHTKIAHYLVCMYHNKYVGKFCVFFPIHPLWFGKTHKICPLVGGA